MDKLNALENVGDMRFIPTLIPVDLRCDIVLTIVWNSTVMGVEIRGSFLAACLIRQ